MLKFLLVIGVVLMLVYQVIAFIVWNFPYNIVSLRVMQWIAYAIAVAYCILPIIYKDKVVLAIAIGNAVFWIIKSIGDKKTYDIVEADLRRKEENEENKKER